MSPPDRCNVLLVYPRFNRHSFWNYQATCELVGAKYSSAPLGLITVAALLPATWNARLVNLNTEELSDSDLDWADLVMTGGMLPQQRDTLRLIDLVHARNKLVVVGGPDVTASPHVYEKADFMVLGEAEEIMAEFVAAWQTGAKRGTFRATRFPDLSTSPVPRFDLLKFDQYLNVGVQLSRGCPFRCEFCNVVELNGRSQRLKPTAQMLRELDTLYALGYRGHVDLVDDNLVGNLRAVKPFLAQLAQWLETHHYPFEFSTEVSLNLADDEELLTLLKRANFFACFVGIETPDSNVLRQAHKTQNVSRNVAQSIAKIYQAGIFVNAGFIIGFDNECQEVATSMIACIEEAAIPVAMVGLLYALPNTDLARRLTAEGRMSQDAERIDSDSDIDQCTSGLNFVTRRPPHDALRDYRQVLHEIYQPRAYFGRARRAAVALDLRGHRLRQPLHALMRDLRSFLRLAWRLGWLDKESRWHWWSAFMNCLVRNPRAMKILASFGALFLHFKPFAQVMDQQISRRISLLPEKIDVPELLPSGTEA